MQEPTSIDQPYSSLVHSDPVLPGLSTQHLQPGRLQLGRASSIKRARLYLASSERSLSASAPHTVSEHPSLLSFSAANSPPPVTMSSCDCDRKDSNGGTCDSSCKEESFGFVENTFSPMSFAPVLAVSKAAGAVEMVSFEGHADHA